MKAVLSKELGGPDTLVVEDIPVPTPGPGQVLLDVKAVGVNYPDVLIIEDQYQIRPTRPFAPGGELSGVVAEVGEGVDSLAVGDRVLSVSSFGAMVEQMAVNADACIPIPDEMPFEDAATLLMTYGTSHYALKDRAQAVPGETLFVLGAAGGVGLAAVQLGKAMGLTVIAGASSQDKVDLALEHGADEGIVYERGPLDRDQQKALSQAIKDAGGGGVDIVYDGVGGDYAEPALRAMNWDGRFLVIGFPAGIPKLPLNLTLLKSCSIVGVFWGAFVMTHPDENRANVDELFRLYQDGKIKPYISSHYPLDQAADAIQELADRKAKGKVVVTV